MPFQKKKQDLADQPKQVLPAALRYLGRREYTAAELRQRLSARGAAAEDIEEALAYLIQRKFQDDERAALAHIHDRLRFAPRGRLLIRQELRQRGLDDELISRLLDEHYPPPAERQALERYVAAQRIESTSEPQEQQKRWLKLARRAAAKGFRQSDIVAVLEAWRQQDGTE